MADDFAGQTRILADLGTARLEVSWIYGALAMDMFTRDHLALRPDLDVTTLPLRDLRAALRACESPISTWRLPHEQVAVMRAGLEESAVALERV